jgi:hypothetical protein
MKAISPIWPIWKSRPSPLESSSAETCGLCCCLFSSSHDGAFAPSLFTANSPLCAACVWCVGVVCDGVAACFVPLPSFNATVTAGVCMTSTSSRAGRRRFWAETQLERVPFVTRTSLRPPPPPTASVLRLPSARLLSNTEATVGARLFLLRGVHMWCAQVARRHARTLRTSLSARRGAHGERAASSITSIIHLRSRRRARGASPS